MNHGKLHPTFSCIFIFLAAVIAQEIEGRFTIIAFKKEK
jgi:hypothetical protein